MLGEKRGRGGAFCRMSSTRLVYCMYSYTTKIFRTESIHIALHLPVYYLKLYYFFSSFIRLLALIVNSNDQPSSWWPAQQNGWMLRRISNRSGIVWIAKSGSALKSKTSLYVFRPCSYFLRVSLKPMFNINTGIVHAYRLRW